MTASIASLTNGDFDFSLTEDRLSMPSTRSLMILYCSLIVDFRLYIADIRLGSFALWEPELWSFDLSEDSFLFWLVEPLVVELEDSSSLSQVWDGCGASTSHRPCSAPRRTGLREPPPPASPVHSDCTGAITILSLAEFILGLQFPSVIFTLLTGGLKFSFSVCLLVVAGGQDLLDPTIEGQDQLKGGTS